MDLQPQASFIPKKPLDIGPLSRGSAGMFGSLLFLICLFVFVVSIVGAAGVFVYQQVLTGSIANKTAMLAKAEGAFDPSVIKELVRLDSRITQARLLLQKHVAPSEIFDFLSAQTLQQVQFNSFEYTLGDDGSAKVVLKGQANSFSTIALQSDQFSASKVLKNVVFSGISLDTNGKISFSVAADIDPSLISYAQTASGASTAQPASASPQVQEAATSTNSGQTTP